MADDKHENPPFDHERNDITRVRGETLTSVTTLELGDQFIRIQAEELAVEVALDSERITLSPRQALDFANYLRDAVRVAAGAPFADDPDAYYDP